MSLSVDNLDILLYNPDIMKEYSILEFAGIDFPFQMDKGMHTRPCSGHSHNFIELEIIIGGSADHIVEGKTYHISKGDVLVIMPSYVHELARVDNLKLFNFKFDLDKLLLMDTDLEKLSGFQALFVLQPFEKYQHDYNSFMKLDEEKYQQALQLCEFLLEEWLKKKPGYKVVIKAYFLTLITFLARNFSPNITNSSPKLPEFLHTLTFIHENYTGKITLSFLSSMACLSERQYTRIFHEIYSMSPIEYVINCRLALACRQLKYTKDSLQEISIKCGFGDKVSFSRLFKKRYGITPGKYRSL